MRLKYLHAGADFVVFGEGEVTMEELLDGPPRGGRRIVVRPKSRASRTCDADGQCPSDRQRAQIADLDAQPWPARQAIDIQRYVKTWRDAHGKGSVNFITARGCPYKCRWCSHRFTGRRTAGASRAGGGRSGMAAAALPARHGVGRRRRVHHTTDGFASMRRR